MTSQTNPLQFISAIAHKDICVFYYKDTPSAEVKSLSIHNTNPLFEKAKIITALPIEKMENAFNKLYTEFEELENNRAKAISVQNLFDCCKFKFQTKEQNYSVTISVDTEIDWNVVTTQEDIAQLVSFVKVVIEKHAGNETSSQAFLIPTSSNAFKILCKLLLSDSENYKKGVSLFLESVYINQPNFAVIAQLEKFFMNHESLPITSDGEVLFYKKVDENYMSIHADRQGNRVNWAPGENPKMDRNEVDSNSSNTCSAGLHVCSRSYLPSFGCGPTSKVVMVAVKPEHICAIPGDYAYSKVRCCEAKVLRDITEELTEDERKTFFSSAVYNDEGSPVDPDCYAENAIDPDDAETWPEELLEALISLVDPVASIIGECQGNMSEVVYTNTTEEAQRIAEELIDRLLEENEIYQNDDVICDVLFNYTLVLTDVCKDTLINLFNTGKMEYCFDNACENSKSGVTVTQLMLALPPVEEFFKKFVDRK